MEIFYLCKQRKAETSYQDRRAAFNKSYLLFKQGYEPLSEIIFISRTYYKEFSDRFLFKHGDNGIYKSKDMFLFKYMYLFGTLIMWQFLYYIFSLNCIVKFLFLSHLPWDEFLQFASISPSK